MTKMLTAGTGHAISSPERRRHDRQLALLRVALLHAGGVSDICVVRNISTSGLSARVYRELAVGEQVEIEFRSGDRLSGTIVWEDDHDVGMVFPEPIDVAAVLAGTRATDPSKRRTLPRIKIECQGRLSSRIRSTVATLKDISQGGANLDVEAPLTECSNVELLLPDLPPVPGVVRWSSGSAVGLSFNECIAFERLAHWIQLQRESGARRD